MRKLLNKKVADSAKPAAKPYLLQDTAITGFCLRVQPSGTRIWQLRYTTPDGKRTVRTLGKMPVWTFEMAKAKAEMILRGEDPDATPEPAPEPDAPMTFEGFLTQHYAAYLEANHSAPSDTLGYIRAFKLGDKALADIKLADVETWRTERKKLGRKPSTINRQCNALKAALQRAVDWDLIETNPLARLKPLKTDKKGVVRYLDHGEEARLLAALKARDDRLRRERQSANAWRRERGYDELPELGEYGDTLTPMVLVSLNTGLRRGELWNLVWGDVDLKRNVLTVRGEGAKSGQTRHVPLNSHAVAALKTHRGDVRPLPSVPVFGRVDHKKAFANVLKAAKVERFRWHDLRHTFASKLVMAGTPLNTVRELLGHASLAMTLRYAHLAPDNLRQAVELLEAPNG